MTDPLDAVVRRIEEIYGADVCFGAGVVHVAAVWCGHGSEWLSMRINQATPRSRKDAFALALARARADAIVTTGEILRREPGLTHDFEEEPARGLLDWRRSVLGRDRLPLTAVLTRGRELDFGHPVFDAGNPSLVFTGRRAVPSLAEAARAAGAEWVEHAEPGIRSLLDYLQRERGLETILVEAGPRSAAALYSSPARVDELLLSLCESEDLSPDARGAEFSTPEEIAAAGLECVSEHRSAEESGPWRFRRYLRKGGLGRLNGA